MKSILHFLTEQLYHFRNTHPLANFIMGRFASMIVILFILGFAVFGLMQLAPGDIVDNYVKQQLLSLSEGNTGSENRKELFSEEQIAAKKAELGLDKPFYSQYMHWLHQVFVEHDLGRSMISRAPILFLIKTRLINSIILNLISLFMLTFISFALGIYFSSKVGTTTDLAATFIALFLHSFPGLLLLILLQLFAAVSGLFPVTAYPGFPMAENPSAFVFSYMHHIALPLTGAFLGGIGGTMRMIRATMLDQLGQPYIQALRARGIKESRVYFAHAFRNTLNPYITS
ncbi:MAG: ABC transporter permease, partial [Spirochaetaceae bacterium 4572_59]